MLFRVPEVLVNIAHIQKLMIGKLCRPCLFRVCAVQRRRFPLAASPTRQSL